MFMKSASPVLRSSSSSSLYEVTVIYTNVQIFLGLLYQIIYKNSVLPVENYSERSRGSYILTNFSMQDMPDI